MATDATTTIVVLFDHEIRQAAEALHALHTAEEKTAVHYANAIAACMGALYHPKLMEGAPVTVMVANKPEN